MQTSSKNLFFTGQLIWFTGHLFMTRFANSKQITPETILQDIYSLFTLCLSYSPPWERVAPSPSSLEFQNVFLSLQLDLLVKLRLECCGSPVVILLFVVYRRTKPLIPSQEHEQVSRKRTAVHGSPDILERGSEQLAAGCNQSPGPSDTF